MTRTTTGPDVVAPGPINGHRRKRPWRLGHSSALDGLRAVAVLGVMAAHAGLPHAYPGRIGVFIFFCLSGFLITSLLLEEFDRAGMVHLRHFWARRVLRLLPALILLIALVTVYAVVFAPGAEGSRDLKATPWALSYAANWRRALLGDGLGKYGHTWSLSVEEQFYVLWPVVLLFVLRRSAQPYRTLVTLALGLSFAVLLTRLLFYTTSVNPFRNEGTDMIADQLLWGCALAVVLRRRGWCPRLKASVQKLLVNSLWIAVPAGVVIFLVAQAIDPSRFIRRAGYSLVLTGIAMATCLVISHIVLSPESRLARVLSLKPMTQIGKVSYGLYLFHYPIFTILALHSGLGHGPVLWVVQFTVTGVVAWLSWVFLEKKVLALKSRFRGVRPAPARVVLADNHLPSISVDSRLTRPRGRDLRAPVGHRDAR